MIKSVIRHDLPRGKNLRILNASFIAASEVDYCPGSISHQWDVSCRLAKRILRMIEPTTAFTLFDKALSVLGLIVIREGGATKRLIRLYVFLCCVGGNTVLHFCTGWWRAR